MNLAKNTFVLSSSLQGPIDFSEVLQDLKDLPLCNYKGIWFNENTINRCIQEM